MPVSRSNGKSNYVLTLMAIGFFLYLLGSFGIRARTTDAIILVIILFALGIYGGWRRIQIDTYKKLWLFATIAQICAYIAPNARHPESLVKCLIYVLLVTIVLLLIKTDWIELKKLFRLMGIISLMASIYISFFRFFPDLYIKLVIPYLGVNTAHKVLENMPFGYGAALGDSYTYGDYLIMIGIAVFLSKDIATGKKDNLAKLFIILCLLGMLMEGRKGELLAATIVVVFVYFITGGHRRFKLNKRALLTLFGIIILLVFLLPYLNNNGFLYRFNVMFMRLKDSTGDFSTGRVGLWKVALEIFGNHPIFGVGWGGYTNYLSGHYISNIDKNMYTSVHNCFLQLLCETGIVGTCFILAPYLIIMIKTLKHLYFLKAEHFRNSVQAVCTIFSLSLQMFFAIVFFIDPVFYNPFFWHAYMIAVAVECYSANSGFNTMDYI